MCSLRKEKQVKSNYFIHLHFIPRSHKYTTSDRTDGGVGYSGTKCLRHKNISPFTVATIGAGNSQGKSLVNIDYALSLMLYFICVVVGIE